MPKLKTHQGTKKRVKRTAKGKLMHGHAYANHFLTKKSSARKRLFAKNYKFKKSDKTKIKRALGV